MWITTTTHDNTKKEIFMCVDMIAPRDFLTHTYNHFTFLFFSIFVLYTTRYYWLLYLKAAITQVFLFSFKSIFFSLSLSLFSLLVLNLFLDENINFMFVLVKNAITVDFDALFLPSHDQCYYCYSCVTMIKRIFIDSDSFGG